MHLSKNGVKKCAPFVLSSFCAHIVHWFCIASGQICTEQGYFKTTNFMYHAIFKVQICQKHQHEDIYNWSFSTFFQELFYICLLDVVYMNVETQKGD